MYSKTSQSSFQDNDSLDHINSKDYRTLAELIKKQNVSSYKSDYWKNNAKLSI